MPIVFKIVSNNKYSYEIKDGFEGMLDLNMLVQLFNFLGVTIEEIDKIKFIIDSDNLVDASRKIMVAHGEEKIVYVFTSDIDTRTKLQNIFIRESGMHSAKNLLSDHHEDRHTISTVPGVATVPDVDSDICNPIIKNSLNKNTISELTQDTIDTMNVKTVSLFMDPDFRNLISVYVRRPELFTTLALYTQNGNIVNDVEPSKSITDLTDDELVYYNSLADKISHLELGVTNDIIITRLLKFNGHLNLTVRSILMDLIK